MSEARFKVTYQPEGVDPMTWEVDLLDGLKVSELIAVKKASGIAGVAELMSGVMTSDPEALKALLWLLLKRNMSTLSWESLDFTYGELRIDYVDDLTDEQKLARLERLEAEGQLNELGVRQLADLREAGVKANPKA